MKRFYLVLICIMSFSPVFCAPQNDIKGRMLRYSTLHKLFDAPLTSININEISQILMVDTWDFESFSDYVIQELSEIPNVDATKCVKDTNSKILTIPLGDNDFVQNTLKADSLTIQFLGESDSNNRTLAVTYTIPVSSGIISDLRSQCKDLLSDLKTIEREETEETEVYSGAYDHIYKIIEDSEGKNILFSCLIPVPAYKWYCVPACYMPEISYPELPDFAPCNSGDEPFSEFLKRFNEDISFRVDRRIWSDTANHADREDGFSLPIQYGFNEYVMKTLDETGLLPFHGHYNKALNGQESCGQWFYPTDNSVIYSGWNIYPDNPDDDCGILILFERVDGQWNTTATLLSWKRFNDIIRTYYM